ncbi:MAG: DUF4097 family beta strand repeat-containing protein, partial [Planctomycetaceae bacterium]
APARPAPRPIRFARLEDRRVFNASFVLNATGLTLDNFTAPGALNVSEGPADLQFKLSDSMGQWVGTSAAGISILENGTLLSVQESLLQGPASSISILASSGQGDVDVILNDSISLSSSSTTAALTIQTSGDVLLAQSTRGPNPILDAPDHHVNVSAQGLIDVRGILHAKSVELHAAGDVTVEGRIDSRSSILVTAQGEVADGKIEQISFRAESLDITAAHGIGNADPLETDVRSLTAINTVSGSLEIIEGGGPGNLSIGRVENIGRFVRLQVTNGSLTDGNDGPGIQPNIRAHDLLLQTSADIGSSGPNLFPLFRNHIEVELTGNLTAAAPGFAAFFGRIDGQLNVQAHDLTLASFGDVDFTRSGQSELQGLALIADFDGKGSGTVLLPDQLSLPESLLIQGADVSAADGSLDLSAGRILFISQQSEDLHISLLATQTGQPGQFDGRSGGSLNITTDSATALADLDGNGFALQSLSATGSLNLTSAADVIVQGKVSAAGSITLASGGTLKVLAAIDPDIVTLTAADDITVTAAISAASRLQISAGTDGTGNLLTSTTSFVEAGVPGIPGDMLLQAGEQQGTVQLNGTVRASRSMTIQATGGSINAGTELAAPTLSLNAFDGLGNLAPLRIKSGTINASTGSGGILLQNSSGGTWKNVFAGAGNIVIENQQAADFELVTATGGDIRLTAVNGPLQVQQAFSEVGDILLLSGPTSPVLVGDLIAAGFIGINAGSNVAEFGADT